jgi:hypothetical protein
MYLWSIMQLDLRIQAYFIKSCFECDFERLWKIVHKLRPPSKTMCPNSEKEYRVVMSM